MTSIANKQLFEEHYGSLCHFAWKLCGDLTQSEDFVQDAFISYFNNQEHVSVNQVAIKNYLYTSVRYAFLNSKRKEKVVEKYWLATPFNESSQDSFELNIIHSEVVAEVHRIVESMPPGCQVVFRMGYFEGLSNQEISKELNISVNTVKTQKQRGMKLVMQKMNPEFLPIVIFLETLFSR
ncbi:RNA polymerase sigma factor [Sphingobacterium sp. SG20118]|uniref:RNA polymerase sigma factor n=1 Tax=Sphingobacterium TaxID=28453 RepID=UPI0004F699B3|nr:MULTISPECIES: sigma-70 family RNA polymerase sigma factor [Sphingobacterium]AIM38726.1 RNA polymerase subunit sigma-24 [Sphingobacterium sp. ML3W]MDH5825297.1 sigma-70 family RNA polymerase sigma factor [Sphingobacterium faecium]